jgi:hypothetical protein
MPVREYTQALGVVLILTGAAGLMFGDRLLLGVLNVVIPKGIAHLLTGSLLAYIGFGQTDEHLARIAVAAIGVVYLFVGVLGVHLLVGILSLVIGFGSGRNTASRA